MTYYVIQNINYFKKYNFYWPGRKDNNFVMPLYNTIVTDFIPYTNIEYIKYFLLECLAVLFDLSSTVHVLSGTTKLNNFLFHYCFYTYSFLHVQQFSFHLLTIQITLVFYFFFDIVTVWIQALTDSRMTLLYKYRWLQVIISQKLQVLNKFNLFIITTNCVHDV